MGKQVTRTVNKWHQQAHRRRRQIQNRDSRMLFESKVVIVTGGAGGIGRATADAFAKEGAHVVIADLDGGRAEDTAKSIRDGGAPEPLAAQCDVSDERFLREPAEVARRDARRG